MGCAADLPFEGWPPLQKGGIVGWGCGCCGGHQLLKALTLSGVGHEVEANPPQGGARGAAGGAREKVEDDRAVVREVGVAARPGGAGSHRGGGDEGEETGGGVETV
jgi:hypothetical protein